MAGRSTIVSNASLSLNRAVDLRPWPHRSKVVVRAPRKRRRGDVTEDQPVGVVSEKSPVIRWLMTEGRHITDAKSFLESFASRLRRAGVDVSRITTGVPVLHPQLFSTSSLWERDKGVTERLYRADPSQDAILANSPIRTAYDGSPFRSRLTTPAEKREFPILTELRRGGMTDYVVLPVPFSDGTNKALSLATSRAGGFSDDEIALFESMTPAVAVNLEIQALRRMARTLLDTYVGRQSGGRVLAGQIRRGMGETISAVIWLSDLRGFTSLSESLPRDELIEMLNNYFGPMCDAVKRTAARSSNSLATPCWRSFRSSRTPPPHVAGRSVRHVRRGPQLKQGTCCEQLPVRRKYNTASRCTWAT